MAEIALQTETLAAIENAALHVSLLRELLRSDSPREEQLKQAMVNVRKCAEDIAYLGDYSEEAVNDFLEETAMLSTLIYQCFKDDDERYGLVEDQEIEEAIFAARDAVLRDFPHDRLPRMQEQGLHLLLNELDGQWHALKTIHAREAQVPIAEQLVIEGAYDVMARFYQEKMTGKKNIFTISESPDDDLMAVVMSEQQYSLLKEWAEQQGFAHG
jgi:hypothetical protein